MQDTTKKERPLGVIGKIAQRVRAGEKKTKREWAEEYGISVQTLATELTRCRNHIKNPYRLYPSPSNGYLVDIMERQEDFRAVMARYDNNVVNHMLAGISALEHGLQAHPELMPFVRERLDSIVSAADDGSRTLLLKGKR